MPEQQPKRCRSCNAEIVFIKNAETGRLIPAQKVRVIYGIESPLIGDPQLRKLARGGGDMYISHFETCPDAARFSGKP